MARTAEITFKEFRRRYNTEDACRAELFRLRFPNGLVCPKCGCVEYYPFMAATFISAVPAGTRLLLPQGRLCTVPICL